MIEKLKKFGRSLARTNMESDDSFFAEGYAAFGGSVAGAILGVVLAGPAGALLGALLSPIAFGLVYGVKQKAESQREVVSMPLGHFDKIVGAYGACQHLKNTQHVINSLTKTFRKASQLPPKVESKLQDYLQDAAEFAAHVRVYDLQGQEKDKIVYTREVFNAQGQSTYMAVGAVKTEVGLMAQQPAPVAPVLPAPTQQKVKVLKPLQYTNNSKNQVTP